MRKFLAVALAVLMLLALMPTASAAVSGSATMSIWFSNTSNVLEKYGDVVGTSAIVQKPFTDMNIWNIPGTAINSEVNGGSSIGKFFKVDSLLAVSNTKTIPLLGTATFSTAANATLTSAIASITDGNAAAKTAGYAALGLTEVTTQYFQGLAYAQGVNSTPYFINGAQKNAIPVLESNPVEIYYDGTNYVARQTLNWYEGIPYEFYVAAAAGGTVASTKVDVYQGVQWGSTIIPFWFSIEYRDNTSVRTGLTVADYGINTDNVRAYMSGSILVIESVWSNMRVAQDTRPVLLNSSTSQNEPNPNYLQSAGYYPIGLQFFFKDAAGNPLSQYTQVTALTYGGTGATGHDILRASTNKKSAYYLPFIIESGMTPYQGTTGLGFGRTAYLDADGSLKLMMQIGQYGFYDQSTPTTANADARFMTAIEFANTDPLLAVSAQTTAFAPQFGSYYRRNAVLNAYGDGGATPVTNMLWYSELANSYIYRGKELSIDMINNGVAYSYKATLEFRSTNRIAATQLSLSETNMTIKVGESKTLSTTIISGGEANSLPVSWVSNNTGIATVAGSGAASFNKTATVKGVTVGNTYIRASLTIDNAEAICNVTVVPADEVVVEPTAPATVTYKVICRKLNVRSGAGTSNSKVGLIARGDEVEVLEVNNDWAKIEWQGGTAYACVGNGKYLQPK